MRIRRFNKNLFQLYCRNDILSIFSPETVRQTFNRPSYLHMAEIFLVHSYEPPGEVH